MPRISFDPARHGWPFFNDFVNHVGPFTTRGLCGGMALAAIDYFANRIEIPRDLTLPPEGSALRNYIFDRQLQSFELMLAEYAWQVGGTDSHHGRWARGALNGSHFNILRRFVDSNKPIPIGLVNRYVGIPSGGDENHHQVLGIGYDILGPNRADVRIHIYDPNHPNKVVILVPIEGSGPPLDRYERSDYDRYVPTWDGTLRTTIAGDPFWGTYFVHDGYTPQFPPVSFPVNRTDCKAWVWANQPDAASYVPSTNYQYNSSGGTNQIVRLGVGQYRVELPNLGTPGGMAQVSAYNGKHFCKVVNWGSSGSTQQVRVNCFSPDGSPIDDQFVLLFYKETRGAARTDAYLWADQPTTAFYTPSTAYQWNSKGLTNTVRRINVGHYEATLSGMNVLGGTVLVSAYGQGTARCKVGGWYQSGNDTVVTVYCFDINGNPVDTLYTLSFMTDVGLGSQGLENQQKGGYVWADQPTAEAYTPNTLYQLNTSGNTNTITRRSAGSYTVGFPKLAAFNSTTAMVTAYGSGSEYCTVQWWTSDGSDGTNVSIQCLDYSGSPVDAQFALTYLTDDRILQ